MKKATTGIRMKGESGAASRKKGTGGLTRVSSSGSSPGRLIDARINELADWRGEMLARVRAVITRASPAVVEEWKWNVPVWSCNGIICTGETYKRAVKLTFAKGAALADPSGVFNSSLGGNTRRAIDMHEGDKIDAKALTAIVRAAVALNTLARAGARPAASRKAPKVARGRVAP